MTQEELGRLSAVTKNMISMYEHERQRPQLDTLEKLLGGLDVDLAELALRLEASSDPARLPSSRRGPRGRSSSDQGAQRLEVDVVRGMVEVFREMAALIRSARPG